MANNIGAAELVGNKDTKDPMQAPMPNRTLPTIEFADPAELGNFSKIEAIALEEINGFCPTNTATPSAIDQKPKSNNATSNNQMPAKPCIPSPKRNMVSAPHLATKRPFKNELKVITPMFNIKK